ncbi:TonB-dependent receptor [Sphingopyxis granuli]|uniref:TonB-dependent receptor domain-containing protein n=1 Tax=Sphingopyxis granuli TaxID=267128 RepID=UPI001BAF205C|nr:TonB-dependent receptor [Sphingopyxis granuli]
MNTVAGLLGLGYKPGAKPGDLPVYLIDSTRDPYAGIKQSRSLREISTEFDPRFKARNDIFQINVDFDLDENVKFFSQSSYSKDYYYSLQDYNRFSTGPIFNDSSILKTIRGLDLSTSGLSIGGVLDDPQLGPSNSILGVDMVRSKSDQWYQEFRIQSAFDGRLNFSLGANYTKFKIHEDYFVFNNLFTAIARGVLGTGGLSGAVTDCSGWDGLRDCTYVDPNPINSINGDGHNYFRSQNIAETRSFAVFQELYWKPIDDLKITMGFRYTDDKKVATPIKSQLLLGIGLFGNGLINEGYQASPDIVQKWGRLTGRVVADWRPHLGFTDDTLFYASFSRGYKGGGANPPGIGANPAKLQFFPQPETFRPESVNAFEIGTKNAFAGGKITLNANAFYYDYRDYQVSQIVDRIALNENYDAKIWGAELELAWRPTPRFRVNANAGYLDTRIDDGMKSIDVMNRTQGNEDWVLLKPWYQLASNCIAPKNLVEKVISNPIYSDIGGNGFLQGFCGGQTGQDFSPGSFYSNMFGVAYDVETDAPNQGRGFDADLGGNQLPNSPHWTLNLGAQYTIPLSDWDLTLRGDYYRQGKSWARVYNTAIDRLKSWDNANISVTLERQDVGLSFQAYMKNVFNKSPITDTFLNSDDSGLTANVFTLDPRIIGINLLKTF